jgi:hypothetical protein
MSPLVLVMLDLH